MKKQIIKSSDEYITYSIELKLDDCLICGSEPELIFHRCPSKILPSDLIIGKIECPVCGYQTIVETGDDLIEMCTCLANEWNPIKHLPSDFDLPV